MLNKMISKVDLKTSFAPISKIESVNPLLTARFYAEYLGFEILAQNDQGNEFMLAFNNQILFLVCSKSESNLKSQTFSLKTKEIEAHYYNLLSKVKIKSNLTFNNFVVIDCEGNTIVFESN